MATTTKIDVKAVRSEAGRAFYAGVGVNDLAVVTVLDAVTDVTKKATERINGVQGDIESRVEAAKKIDLAPKALYAQATDLVGSVTKDAKAKLAELEAEVKAAPAKAKGLLDHGVETVTTQYGELAKRGEDVVGRIRKQEKVAGAVDKVTEVTESVSERVEKVAEIVSERVEKVTESVSDAVEMITESVNETVAPVRKIVAKKAVEVEETLELVIEDVAKTVTDGADQIKAAVKAPAAKPVAKKAPAKKAPAAKKAPVAKPAAKKAPVKVEAKPAVAKPTATKAPAKKAPAKTTAPQAVAPTTVAPKADA